MLFHDIIIPLGVLAYLGHVSGAQLTIPVITALLTVVGYCINNTVVVFDRIRENLIKNRGKELRRNRKQKFKRNIDSLY
jgi:preprotein translocase subunit SecF